MALYSLFIPHSAQFHGTVLALSLRWDIRVLVRLLPLHPAKSWLTVVHVEYRVHGFEHSIAVDIHVHVTSGLNAAVHHAVTCIRKAKVFLLEDDLRVADSERDLGELVCGCVGWEDVALVALIVLRSGDCSVSVSSYICVHVVIGWCSRLTLRQRECRRPGRALCRYP